MGYGLIGPIFNRLQAYTRCLDNGGSSGTGYCPSLSFRGFDWQLGGPFNGGVRTGITPFPGSLGRRINAYSSSSTLFGLLTCERESTAGWVNLSTGNFFPTINLNL